MTELSVLFLGHPQSRQSGDWLHRVAWPAKALGRHAKVTEMQTLHPGWVRQALAVDVLVVLMIAEPILGEVIRQRRATGRATVFEISDDFTAVAAANPLVGFYARPEVQAQVRELAGLADATEFSSDFLAAKFAGLNARPAIFRNQLHTVPMLPERAQTGRLRIGWAGSLGHLEDARRLAAWIAAWPEQGGVEWCLMCAPEIACVFQEAGVEVEVRPTGSMEAYFGFLNSLDVGLAWVGDDDFSRGRSDGKFLEYAAHGVLPVCRNSPVYATTLVDGETGLLFDDQAGLHAILERLLKEPETARQIGGQARCHVVVVRTHEGNSRSRFDFYAGLTTARSADECGYVEEIDEIEADLYRGMQMVNRGERVEALNQVLGVMERMPDFYFVWQVLETICLQLGRAEEAQQCARRKAVLLYQDMPF